MSLAAVMFLLHWDGTESVYSIKLIRDIDWLLAGGINNVRAYLYCLVEMSK